MPAGALTAVTAVPAILEDADTLPIYLRTILASVHEQIRAIEARVADHLERELRALADADPVVIRLRTIPGIVS